MLRRTLFAIAVFALGAAGGIAVHLLTAEGDTMFSGKRPADLGLHEGRFSTCARRLNCVSSFADPGDAQRYVAPIDVPDGAAKALAAARRAVEATPRARVVRHEANYLHAEFRTRILGFVDDVEFTYDERAGRLHVRSASRLGRRDFGVNRARVEALRARIEAGLRA